MKTSAVKLKFFNILLIPLQISLISKVITSFKILFPLHGGNSHEN